MRRRGWYQDATSNSEAGTKTQLQTLSRPLKEPLHSSRKSTNSKKKLTRKYEGFKFYATYCSKLVRLSRLYLAFSVGCRLHYVENSFQS